jgi:UDP-N-acetyl-D-glucosamine dehydrogenase
VVAVSSARVAEATKLAENVFRAVNIALVNELKMVYDRLGVDIWEVLDAAATKPFGYMRFDPGPGWGGHCIPVDPFYLAWKSRQAGIDSRFVELAGEINLKTVEFVVEKIAAALAEGGRAVAGSGVLLLGAAYKRDVGDHRESPALELIARLAARGARLSYHDPHVPELPAGELPPELAPELAPLRSVALAPEVVAAADCVVVVTDHRDVDYALVARHARLLVDTRGVYRDPALAIVRA